MDCSIIDYGAVGDGLSDCTQAFRRAIEACHAAGGGKVIVPPGRYVTGTVRLLSGVYLYTQANSTILGSEHYSDYYGSTRGGFWRGNPADSCGSSSMNQCCALILADRAENCGILGHGTIDGRRSRELGYTDEKGRPFLVLFSECVNIQLSGQTLQNSGMFTVFLVECDHAKIDGLRINTLECANGDGIDTDGSRNVFISNCHIAAGDDAISIKNLNPETPSENICITNCVITSKYWACVRIGPESAASVRNVTVSNCIFRNCGDGIKLQLTETSLFENFCFSNIVMDNVMRPFFFTLSSYRMTDRHQEICPKPGILRNILLSNITATMPRLFMEHVIRPEAMICGLPDAPITDLKFQNVHLLQPGGGSSEVGCRTDYPDLLNYNTYPELLENAGESPGAVLFLNHAANVTFTACDFAVQAADGRPALAAWDVSGLKLLLCSQRNCGSLIRAFGPVPPELIHCQGTSSAASEEEQAQWQAFHTRSLETLEIVRGRAEQAQRLAACAPAATLVPGVPLLLVPEGRAVWLMRLCSTEPLRVKRNGIALQDEELLPAYRFPMPHVLRLDPAPCSEEMTLELLGDAAADLYLC